MSARAGFKGIKRMCISSSPVSTNQEQPSLEEVLRDLNESTDVPSCVKFALNAMVAELEKVQLERDKLRDENKELRRRLGISPDDELNSTSVANDLSSDERRVNGSDEPA
ncbi:unnamed protein product [Heligmosomoides polygyrus]|uniref:RH1 domain-containing protein n=1 Tax=Heligmosomoides polygyrus TaxID=6339 RepID=A0A183FIB9_HELPZ|nr:unnamed protein product [Heligmosomoides polygyrus]